MATKLQGASAGRAGSLTKRQGQRRRADAEGRSDGPADRRAAQDQSSSL